MSYKRFDPQDIVVSSDAVTAPCWSNNTVILETFETSNTQTAATSGKYYYHVFNTGSASTSAAVQFSVAHGNRIENGAPRYDASVTGSYSRTGEGYLVMKIQTLLSNQVLQLELLKTYYL